MKNTKNKKTIMKKILVVAVFALLLTFIVPIFSNVASAEDQGLSTPITLKGQPYQPLSPLPGTTGTTLGGYLTGLFKLVIGIAIILAVVMMILSGLEYMVSEAVGKKEEAIKKINAALFGLLLTFGSYVFLNTINPALVDFKLNIETAIVTDTRPPGDPGWYCQYANKTWSTPYDKKEVCERETKCDIPCVKLGTYKLPGTSSNNAGAQLLTKYYDKESGWYFLEKPTETNPDDREPNGPHNDKDPSKPTCEATRQILIANNPNEQKPGPCYLQLGPNDDRLAYILLDEIRVRDKLFNDAKTTINRTPCKSVDMDSCTNVGGLEDKTINGLILLRTMCPTCTIVITGGTEWFHHDVRALYPNNKGTKDYEENNSCHRPLDPVKCSGAVDLRFDTSSDGKGVFNGLNKYIAENVVPPVTKPLNAVFEPQDMTKWYPKDMEGAWFRFEKLATPHWHVEFK